MTNAAEVGDVVLDLASMEAAEPAQVLDGLVDAAERLFGLTAGAALLSDGAVRGVVASGPRRPRDALSAGFGQGPGGECARSGNPVLCTDLSRERHRWLAFVAKATAAGISAAWALPVRREAAGFGALLLLGERDSVPDLRAAGVLAEAAAVGILRANEREHAAHETRQLRAALESRVTVEQAKGILAAHARIDVGTAFEQLRTYARRRGRSLTELASAVVHGEIAPDTILEARGKAAGARRGEAG